MTFSVAALTFLTELERNNDRAWFKARKDLFDRELKVPMLHVIDAVGERLEAFAPRHVRPAEKAMMRIYRDVRFAKDKTPYKTNIAATWPRQGLAGSAGASFYLQVSGREVLLAGGCYQPTAAGLAAIRHYLIDHHLEFRAIQNDPALVALAAPFAGPQLSRAPRGIDPGHPAIDLLMMKRWGALATLSPIIATEPDLVAVIVEHFRAMTPLVEFLNRAIQPQFIQERARGKKVF